jgi:hypothetical protein
MRAVGLFELLGYRLRAVGGAVVDDYELPVDVARRGVLAWDVGGKRRGRNAPTSR